jgi:hypothetical protein
MTLTIGQYLETMLSPDGRFASLERLHPVRDDRGGPVFAMPGHGLVDFETVAFGRPHTLRCPLLWNRTVAAGLRSIAERDGDLDGRFFTRWELLEQETVLFTENGDAVRVDILARHTPGGTPLKRYLDAALARGDTWALADVARGFDEMAEWNRRAGRGGIALERVIVRDRGEVALTGFSATDETERIERMLKAYTRYEDYVWDGDRGVATVNAEGCWSLAAVDGTTLTAERYDWIGECSEGLFLAQRDGKCGYLDPGGREVIPCRWDDAASFSEGRALVCSGGERFFIDREGERI